jgi:hypothetical protein
VVVEAFAEVVAAGAFGTVVVADDFVDEVVDFAVARRTGFLRRAS